MVSLHCSTLFRPNKDLKFRKCRSTLSSNFLEDHGCWKRNHLQGLNTTKIVFVCTIHLYNYMTKGLLSFLKKKMTDVIKNDRKNNNRVKCIISII